MPPLSAPPCNGQQHPNNNHRCLRSLLAHLSRHFVTAATYHLALGALAYQRCSYRSATEHYRRSTSFLMRREDALNRYGVGIGEGHDERRREQAEELTVEAEKMQFYTYVLFLNNSADVEWLHRVGRGGGGGCPPCIPSTAAATADGTGRRRRRDHHHGHNRGDQHCRHHNHPHPNDNHRRHRRPGHLNLPPPRLAFFLDGATGASYVLDSSLMAHRTLTTTTTGTTNAASAGATASSSSTANPQDQEAYPDQNYSDNHCGTETNDDDSHHLRLLKSYVMYNLALCHVALGSYPEALGLLTMVRDEGCCRGRTAAAASSSPPGRERDPSCEELDDVLGRYRTFVEEVMRVIPSATATPTSSASVPLPAGDPSASPSSTLPPPAASPAATAAAAANPAHPDEECQGMDVDAAEEEDEDGDVGDHGDHGALASSSPTADGSHRDAAPDTAENAAMEVHEEGGSDPAVLPASAA